MHKPVVSIIKHTDTYDSLNKVIESCDGLKGFDKNDKILIKPNLVALDFDLPFPPFGVLTTSAVVFSLVQILYEKGFSNIMIGEGSLSVSGSMTKKIFEELGYINLQNKFGVELVDFNEGEFEEIDFGDLKLSVAKKALEADRIINIPVLKTHNQCKVSLGIKNLKGCLNRKSKIKCHGKDIELDHTFPRLTEKLPVDLTIIDGIFALAKGPGATGKAYRKDLLIASRDIFSCDLAGSYLIGYDTNDVGYLDFFKKYNLRNVDLSNIKIRGEDIEKHKTFLECDWEWTEEDTGPKAFEKRGITGLAVRKYDDSLCTACSKLYNPMLVLLMSAYKGEPFPGVEVLTGKRQKASPGFEKTVLFGKCAYLQNKDNTNIKNGIYIKGCPPDINEFIELLKKEGIYCDYNEYVNFRHRIYNRYRKEDGFDMELFYKS